MLQITHLEGLKVSIDRITYQYDPENFSVKTPHAFVYFISIHNLSDRTVQILARKWILEHDNGKTEIIEGEKITGQTPTIAPGDSFSYNSYHLSPGSASAFGAYYGVDDNDNPISIAIPRFEMAIPSHKA